METVSKSIHTFNTEIRLFPFVYKKRVKYFALKVYEKILIITLNKSKYICIYLLEILLKLETFVNILFFFKPHKPSDPSRKREQEIELQY